MQSSVLTTKGETVMPRGLRDKYKMIPGSKVIFEETVDGIIKRKK
jgi:bifunctional DNA-binding transcriptional regulator/antitoxin component of YhaV-PrlF toxin-antitoxin module